MRKVLLTHRNFNPSSSHVLSKSPIAPSYLRVKDQRIIFRQQRATTAFYRRVLLAAFYKREFLVYMDDEKRKREKKRVLSK